MSEPTRDEVELLSPENLKVVEDCIDMGKDDGDIATIHIDRLQAVLDGYKAALAANREKDAEIERLKQHLTAVQHIAVRLQEQRDENQAELSSLRASGGEKDAYIELLKSAIKDHISDGHHFGPRSAALRNALAGVAPPTLTREKE